MRELGEDMCPDPVSRVHKYDLKRGYPVSLVNMGPKAAQGS